MSSTVLQPLSCQIGRCVCVRAPDASMWFLGLCAPLGVVLGFWQVSLISLSCFWVF